AEGNVGLLPQEPLPRHRRRLADQLRERGGAERLADAQQDAAGGPEPEIQPHRFAKIALGFHAARKRAPRRAERPHLRRQDRLQPRRAHREQHRALLYDILWYVATAMRQAKGEQVRRELLPGQSVALLEELHLVGRDGALHADSLRKLKQVNHLVQLLEPSLRDVLERHPEPVLMVLRRHACDTATDDALLLALRHDADHIAVVPCCQAEVAAQLKENRHAAPQPWPLLWSHAIHRREIGSHLTNVIRALAL